MFPVVHALFEFLPEDFVIHHVVANLEDWFGFGAGGGLYTERDTVGDYLSQVVREGCCNIARRCRSYISIMIQSVNPCYSLPDLLDK